MVDMSWDLLVALHESPAQLDPASFFSAEFELSGSFRGAARQIMAERRRKSREPLVFTVDGPLHVEPEDLPEELAEVVLAPSYLVQFSAPVSST